MMLIIAEILKFIYKEYLLMLDMKHIMCYL